MRPFGETVDTGAGARSIVFTPDGRLAYLSAAEEDKVYGYTVAADGGVVPLPVPAVSSGGDTPFGTAMAPSGRTLYVANLESGTVTVFGVHPDGSLAPQGQLYTGVVNPRNVAVSTDGRLLFVSHGAPSDTDGDPIVTFTIQPDGTHIKTSVTDPTCGLRRRNGHST
jgi:6-phosphogluconolactonase (cycloisomerase 2 family)